jgi:hypothetical protein
VLFSSKSSVFGFHSFFPEFGLRTFPLALGSFEGRNTEESPASGSSIDRSFEFAMSAFGSDGKESCGREDLSYNPPILIRSRFLGT